MAHQRSSGSEKSPRRIYAFVDSVVEAIPNNPRSRLSIHLDAVDADAFDSDIGSVGDDDSLMLARISTTPKRLEQLFGIPKLNEGSWYQLQLEKQPGRPRSWLFPRANNYEPLASVNSLSIEEIADESETAVNLNAACRAEDVEHIVAADGTQEILPDIDMDGLRITALDVGQASCVAFFQSGRCVGYFDVGAPMFFNRKSYPRKLDHIFAPRGFVILSHWDFDHFSLAYKAERLKRLQWFAPDQPVGPNAAALQRQLGDRLKFIDGDFDFGAFKLSRCTGTSAKDRNSTGYVLRVDLPDTAIMLTGDADYQWIKPDVRQNISRLMIPHHAGGGSNPPAPAPAVQAIAVASYGLPNTYRHPNEDYVRAHRRLGWRIRRTATHKQPNVVRGNRNLHPL